jgi:RHS repeat-associated protein
VRGRLVGLTRTGLTASFGYRQDGIRTSKTLNGTATSYLLDGDSILKETTSGVATDVLQGPGVDAVLKRGSRWFTPDGLGSTSTLTDSAGAVQQRYAYQPFGQASPSPSPGDPQPFQFAGRENDGTGLYYCRARYYVPDWGRFLSEDPAGSGLNWYVYCNNNPVNCTDPTGHDWLNTAANFFGGYGDGLTGGLTKTVRGWLGAGDVVDESSQAYRAGVGVGIAHMVLLTVAEGGAGAAGAAGDAEAGAAAGAGEAATGADAGAVGGAAGSEDDGLIEVYRGVARDHPGYGDAVEGNAYPQGGPADAVMHNRGDTASPFTSWTTRLEVAERYAEEDGVILYGRVPPSELHWSPDFFDEAEVLRRGPVTGAEVWYP